MQELNIKNKTQVEHGLSGIKMEKHIVSTNELNYVFLWRMAKLSEIDQLKIRITKKRS